MDRQCRTFYSSDSPILPLCIILLAFNDTAGVGNLIVNDSDILQIYSHEFPWVRVNIWNCFGAEMYHILDRWGRRRTWGVFCFLTTIFIQKIRIILDSSTVKPRSNVFKCVSQIKFLYFLIRILFCKVNIIDWDFWITVPSSKSVKLICNYAIICSDVNSSEINLCISQSSSYRT